METIAKGERREKRAGRGGAQAAGRARKIGASTQYDFGGGVLTAYGRLLPLAVLWEKLGLLALVDQWLTVRRQPESLSNGQFVVSTVLLFFLGFSRYYQVRSVRQDEMVQGVIGGAGPLPVQSTYGRFLDSLRPHNEGQLMKINTEMSRRVWAAGKVRLKRIYLDTDSTMNTVYGDQMGARKGYNLRRRGAKGLQPLLSFVAETGECVRGKQHNGSSANGEEMAAHITAAMRSMGERVEEVVGRMDAGFDAKEVVEAIESLGESYSYLIVAQKTSALVRALEAGDWKEWAGSGGVSEFQYQPEGWNRSRRFVAVRYAVEQQLTDQYQLFSTEPWKYRVFVTNRVEEKRALCRQYDGRATAENYIKEGCNDAGFGVLSGQNFKANQNYLQMAILAYNSNRWLQLIALSEKETYQRNQLRTERLRLVFVAAKLVVHEGRNWVRFSQSYGEQDRFHRLMGRLRSIKQTRGSYTSSRAAPLTDPCFGHLGSLKFFIGASTARSEGLSGTGCCLAPNLPCSFRNTRPRLIFTPQWREKNTWWGIVHNILCTKHPAEMPTRCIIWVRSLHGVRGASTAGCFANVPRPSSRAGFPELISREVSPSPPLPRWGEGSRCSRL